MFPQHNSAECRVDVLTLPHAPAANQNHGLWKVPENKVARIPVALNIALFNLLFGSQMALLFLTPFVAARFPSVAVGAFVVAVTAMVLPAWYLMHESVHDGLHPNRQINRWMGRALGLVNGVPYTGVRVAHLLHHRWNRIEEFSESYDPAQVTWLKANLKHYFLLLGGLYWVELIGGLALFLPASIRLRLSARLAGDNTYMKRVYQAMNSTQNLKSIRTESLCILTLDLASFFVYGSDLRALFLFMMSTRAFLISFFDNSFHYETATNPGDNSAGTRNHSMPMAWMILNFNYHWTHHRNPRISWVDLPRYARHSGTALNGNYFHQALRQFRGAIPKRHSHNKGESCI